MIFQDLFWYFNNILTGMQTVFCLYLSRTMSKILTIQNHLFQKVESENIQITEKRFKPQYVFVLV